jgi:hypothetical protein
LILLGKLVESAVFLNSVLETSKADLLPSLDGRWIPMNVPMRRAPIFSTATWIALCGAVALRIILFVGWPSALDTDECSHALMAMSLFEDPRFIVGWFGQDHMGSLEIYLLASVFWAGSSSPTTIRLIMLFVTIGQILLLLYIANRIGGRPAAIGVLIAFSLLSPFAYSFALRTRGYQLMVLLVLLALAVQARLSGGWIGERSSRPMQCGLIGILLGVSLWTNELAILLMPPLVLSVCAANRGRLRGLPALAVGAVIGFLPRIVYNLRFDLEGAKFLVGRLTGTGRAEFQEHGWRSLLDMSLNTNGLAVRYHSVLEAFGAPLCTLLLASIGLLLLPPLRRKILKPGLGPLVTGLLLSILLAVAIASKTRYAVIAVPYVALLVGVAAGSVFGRQLTRLRVVGLGLLVCGAISVAWAARAWVPEKDVPEAQLTAFLQESGHSRGVSGYHLAQKIMYYSGGDLAVSSLGGPDYRTRFMDVERRIDSNGAQFAVYEDFDLSPHAAALEEFLGARGIDHEREVIAGRFLVFHSFDRPIHPVEFLRAEDRPWFEKYEPSNPRVISQERANRWFGG